MAENPQWLWMSHQWIAAERTPEFIDPIPEFEEDPRGGSPARAWNAFVMAVQTHADHVILPAFHPGQIHTWVKEEGENAPYDVFNGLWPAFSCFQRLENMLYYIPTGVFWIGLHGDAREKQALPMRAGVFVGFRRKGRPQKNPWWWEVVYAVQDGTSYCTLTVTTF